MSEGPFIWKQALFAPEVRIEISGDVFHIETPDRRQEMKFDEISGVYLYRMQAPLISHMRITEVTTNTGATAKFLASGYGIPGQPTEEYKRASVALLNRLHLTNTKAEFFNGIRPSPKYKITVVAVGIAAFCYVAVASWLQPNTAEWQIKVIALAIVFLIGAFVFWLQLRDSAIARRITFDDAVALLD